jgi:hypothetical protein
MTAIAPEIENWDFLKTGTSVGMVASPCVAGTDLQAAPAIILAETGLRVDVGSPTARAEAGGMN